MGSKRLPKQDQKNTRKNVEKCEILDLLDLKAMLADREREVSCT